MAERDLTLLSKALETYMEFLSLYPNASEAPAVRKDVLEVRNRLSEKELLIGDFYFKTDFVQAAKPRYEKVIQYFPDTESARLAEEKLEILRKKIEAAEEIKTHGLPNNK
jgi:outer membrane protein assembly factor BamD (BamD/ComL family)